MSRFLKAVHQSRFSLLVSVPRNHPDMAKAAEAGGADAVKVHINCRHPASGQLFGSFHKERKNLEAVLKAITIPLGIVPGGAVSENGVRVAPAFELLEMKKMGFDFFDIFAHHMPLDYLDVPLGRMICLDSRYADADVRGLVRQGAELFEASIIPHEGYGKPVAFSDLARWSLLAENSTVPVFVSTQRKIRPEECGLLRQAGIRGVVIGVVVTGNTTVGVHETVKRFRKAIDKLGR